MKVRRAKVKDVSQIVQLINFYARQGEMLGRTQVDLYNSIRDFIVAEKDAKVIGVGALAIIWNDLAEIRSLAIDPDFVGKGYGRQIVQHLLDEAKELEMPQVFTLTYQPHFFEKMGFKLIDKHELPHKVWKDCINCPKFPDCDENALILPLSA